MIYSLKQNKKYALIIMLWKSGGRQMNSWQASDDFETAVMLANKTVTFYYQVHNFETKHIL